MSAQPRALVVGMGIGGLATALRLHDIGWETVLVERARERRSTGYAIGLFESGRAAAARLGVLDAMIGPGTASTIHGMDRNGRRRPGLKLGAGPSVPSLVMRADVETALFDAVSSVTSTQLRFATSPVAVQEGPASVAVTLRTNGVDTTENFDLVVGADGLRSTVRRLVFGPDRNFLLPFSHMIAAATLRQPLPGFRREDGLIMAEVGRSALVFPIPGRQPSVVFTYRSDDPDDEFTRPAAESVRRAFGPEPFGMALTTLIRQFEDADDFFFDSTHQVRMPSWHNGRVVLLGDAAWCPTVYSGIGASSALAGADLLGTCLQRSPGNVVRALREWEGRMRPFISRHQERGRRAVRTFVPRSRRDLALRSLSRIALAGPIGTLAAPRLFKAAMDDVAAP